MKDMDNYQRLASKTAIYPDRHGSGGLTYAVLGLANEAGEVAGKLKKIMRDDAGRMSPSRRDEIGAELGDVLWYVAMVADELRINLSHVARHNLDKLGDRKERGVLGGSGDDR